MNCAQCGKPMNPVARMLGPVCGACCKANHAAATGQPSKAVKGRR